MTRPETKTTAADVAVPALQLTGLDKRYDNGVHAVRDVHLTVTSGEVHAVIGENGAGKSTVAKMIGGLEQPDRGTIRVHGGTAVLAGPRDAIAHGIGMVHQHFMLVPSLTIAENILLGREPGPRVRVDRSATTRRAAELAEDWGLRIDPGRLVSAAPVGMRQRAEILKAVGQGARILLLDEPTAVLTPQEVDELFAALRRLSDGGLTVLFISHKLDEVRAISDQITVMRSGQVISTLATADSTEDALATAMVGRRVALERVPRTRTPPDHQRDQRVDVLTIDELRLARGDEPPLGPLSLHVETGEILGIAGIEGHGQSELVRCVAGDLTPDSGRISVADHDLAGRGSLAAREAGVAHIPEDRQREGSAVDLSIEDNLIVHRHRAATISRHGRLDRRATRALAKRLTAQFRVRAPDPRVPISALSGGNAQKVVIARELSAAPYLVLAAHPTRGVDVGAMEFVYAELRDARDRGAAILVISADLNELLRLSDRLLVIRDGRLVGEFTDVDGVTKDQLGRLMLGLDDRTASTDLGRET